MVIWFRVRSAEFWSVQAATHRSFGPRVPKASGCVPWVAFQFWSRRPLVGGIGCHHPHTLPTQSPGSELIGLWLILNHETLQISSNFGRFGLQKIMWTLCFALFVFLEKVNKMPQEQTGFQPLYGLKWLDRPLCKIIQDSDKRGCCAKPDAEHCMKRGRTWRAALWQVFRFGISLAASPTTVSWHVFVGLERVCAWGLLIELVVLGGSLMYPLMSMLVANLPSVTMRCPTGEIFIFTEMCHCCWLAGYVKQIRLALLRLLCSVERAADYNVQIQPWSIRFTLLKEDQNGIHKGGIHEKATCCLLSGSVMQLFLRVLVWFHPDPGYPCCCGHPLCWTLPEKSCSNIRFLEITCTLHKLPVGLVQKDQDQGSLEHFQLW